MRLVISLGLLLAASSSAAQADAFDHYVNPVLAKAPSAKGVKELARLPAELLTEHEGVLKGIDGALLVVRTNDGSFGKLLGRPARKKIDDDNTVPMLLIDRFATYKDGEERRLKASGQNVHLFAGFHFSMDMGQVVPADLGGDLKYVFEEDKGFVVALGKAKLYLVTEPLPEAAPRKGTKFEVGEVFRAEYFNGSYKLYDDGRRSGILRLKVDEEGNVSGVYISDQDGAEYEVVGKVGNPKHSIQFVVKLPRTEQTFQGLMFTGDGKAIAGTSKVQNRDMPFYAVRLDEE
jgi:hypothetical protein